MLANGEATRRGVSSGLFLLVLPCYALPFFTLMDSCESSVSYGAKATFTGWELATTRSIEVGQSAIVSDIVPTAWAWPAIVAVLGAILSLHRRWGALLSILISIVALGVVYLDFSAFLFLTVQPDVGFLFVLALFLGAGGWGVLRWRVERKARNAARAPP